MVSSKITAYRISQRKNLNIRDYKIEDYDWLYELLIEAFPPDERPTEEHLKGWFKRSESRALIIEKNDGVTVKKLGFLLCTQLDGFLFGEYMAMKPTQRNLGIGKSVLNYLKESLTQPLLFECEMPQKSEMAKRRYDYYKRIGFYHYPMNYVMPALHENEEPMPMCLMGGGPYISKDKLGEMVRQVYKCVYQHVIRNKENRLLIKNNN